MTAQILDGRPIAAALRQELAEQVAGFRHQYGFGPVLAVVRVGNDPASISYARMIDQSFRQTGFGYELVVLEEDAPFEELAELLDRLGHDPAVHGVMLQRPLPPHLNADTALAHLPVGKDVEGVTPLNLGRLLVNTGDYFPTSTPSAAIVLRQRCGIPIRGRHAVVVGRSVILGRPLSLLLLHENATVTTCHTRTPDLGAFTRQADILIAAAGKPRLISGEMVKPGAVVIDFGVNYVEGKMTGDVDFDSVSKVAGALTPVPGGTGPITTVMLLSNTLKAAQLQAAGQK
ncbi:MAG: bifunctional 5,10-methylenetetrahydrofolate dehydrogenase/5,10-methenyltetrahydrofolate cyclohydrolase [Rudaea sp.]